MKIVGEKKRGKKKVISCTIVQSSGSEKGGGKVLNLTKDEGEVLILEGGGEGKGGSNNSLRRWKNIFKGKGGGTDLARIFGERKRSPSQKQVCSVASRLAVTKRGVRDLALRGYTGRWSLGEGARVPLIAARGKESGERKGKKIRLHTRFCYYVTSRKEGRGGERTSLDFHTVKADWRQ